MPAHPWLRASLGAVAATLIAAAPSAHAAGATTTPTPTSTPTSTATAAARTPVPTPAAATPAPTPASTPTPSPSAPPAPAASPTPAAPPPATAPTPPPAPGSDPRYFPQTGYRIAQDAFWQYFLARGAVQTFGYPVSNTFELLGLPVQIFQREVMQLQADGHVTTLNLLDPGLLPFTHFNGSTVPAFSPSLLAQAPAPNNPAYLDAISQFVKANAPDTFDGHPVNFGQTFFNTVSPAAAFPDGEPPNGAALLAGFDLEIWGLPTSAPAYDPANHQFIYQRFQRGIMHYDSSCNCTQGLLLADYLKSLLTGQNVPPDLAHEAAGSSFLDQWAPGRPQSMARPTALAGTDLTGAFNAPTTAASAPPPTPAAVVPPPPPTPFQIPPGVGADISFPSCKVQYAPNPMFAIVGVNGGRPFDPNPCLASELGWARTATSTTVPPVAIYMNTANPGPGNSHWPKAGSQSPEPCDGTWTTACAFDYGFAAAQTAMAWATTSNNGASAATLPWWLDVETSNSWSDDPTTNVASLAGTVAGLRSLGVSTIGIYTNAGWWKKIAGVTDAASPVNAPFGGIANWVPAGGPDALAATCARSITGGPVRIMQYPGPGVDLDMPCP